MESALDKCSLVVRCTAAYGCAFPFVGSVICVTTGECCAREIRRPPSSPSGAKVSSSMFLPRTLMSLCRSAVQYFNMTTFFF